MALTQEDIQQLLNDTGFKDGIAALLTSKSKRQSQLETVTNLSGTSLPIIKDGKMVKADYDATFQQTLNQYRRAHEELVDDAAREAADRLLANSEALKGQKGDKGEQGDTVVLGDGVNFILYNDEGEHTDGGMTQKAVTLSLCDIRKYVEEMQNILKNIGSTAEGYVRVAGSSSPILSYKSYKRDGGDFDAESVFNIFWPCLVGTALSGASTVGKILYKLKKFGAKTVDGVAKWEDINGNLHNIDGTEGDVMICNIVPYYRIAGKRDVDGVTYDVFLMSVLPFSWHGYKAEKVEKYGQSPDYCVSHTDSDGVNRMHSVYNPAWNGSYSSPQAVTGRGVFTSSLQGGVTETYDSNATILGGAGGLGSTDLSLYVGEQRAMNNNNDRTKTVPWMNYTAAMVENLMALVLAEGGTFDIHHPAKFGSGFTSNDPAISADDYNAGTFARNGVRVKDKNDEWKYYALGTNVNFLGGTTSALYGCFLMNSWRNPWHIMEAQRAVSFAIQHDIPELEWFAFEGNKYKWRSVEGFAGPAQGEMTCVVFKFISTKAGSAAVDPTDRTTSIAGNRVEMVLSTGLVHGITTQASPLWWTSGLTMVEYDDGTYKCYMQRDQSQLMLTPTGDTAIANNWDFEVRYKHIMDIARGEGYNKDYNNDALMLPADNASKTGASLHNYIARYSWYTGTIPTNGVKTVRGFLRGISAGYSGVSPFSVYAYYSPSNSASYVAFGTCCRIEG